MEVPEKLHLDILRKIHGRSMDNDTSFSDSEPETESGNSFGTPRSGASDIGTPLSGDSNIGTPRSGTSDISTPRSTTSDIGTPRSGTSDISTPRSTTSDIGTPRSNASDDSTIVSSPCANLLWDHGFDVARNMCKSPEERDTEWRRFNNKTDDDKIIADKRRMEIKKIAHKLQKINEREVEQPSDKPTRKSHGLPDLIPSTSMSYVHSSVRSSQETLYAIDDIDLPPPLPDSEPPDMECSDSPPPLPSTSPPVLIKSYVNVLELIGDDQCPDDSVGSNECVAVKHDNNVGVTHSSDSDDTSELCNKDPLQVDSEEECCSSSAEDFSDLDSDQIGTNFDGCYNVQTYTVLKMESDSDNTKMSMDLSDNIEAEFDFLLDSLNLDSDTQDTYVERFAGRRDRYGFILSPVVEGPSPTPSNMSGYSSYSGISSSSPDPLGIFRMSPGPNRGSKHDIDLSSLCVKPIEWDLATDQTVPIYQTVHAKRALAIPESNGWDSGDDLLSPSSSGDWDSYDNGLSSPPVSTTSVNFTQFGTHIIGWKQPDVAIFEEPENDSSDTTIDDETCSDTDSTIDDDSPRDHTEESITVKECESPEKNLLHLCLYAEPEEENPEPQLLITGDDTDMDRECISITGESIHSLELSLLEDEINEVENELKLLKKHSENNGNLIKNTEYLNEMNNNVRTTSSENYDDGNVNALGHRLDNNFHEFSAEIADINHINSDGYMDSEQRTNSENIISVNSSLDRRCRNPIIRVDSKHTFTTTDDESDTTESFEDAEDEYSASDNDKEESKESDFEEFKATQMKKKLNDKVIVAEMAGDKDDIFVTELLSPRSAILLSGGMFPEETETSSITSDEDVPGELTPDTNMCSYGSGHIKISHYTSGESDDDYIGRKSDKNDEVQCHGMISHTAHNSFRKTADTQEQLLIQDNLPDKEHSADIIKPIIIHSPLDFALLDSKFESVNRGDLKQSQKIFGRYYAEMDLELLEEVRSKCDSIDTTRSEPEQPNTFQERTEQALIIPDRGMPIDADEFDRSFLNIEFSSSADSHPKKRNEIDRSKGDKILSWQIFESESGTYEPVRKDDINMQMTTFRNDTCAEDAIVSQQESFNQQTDDQDDQEGIVKREDDTLDKLIATCLNEKDRHRKNRVLYSINSGTEIQRTSENISSPNQSIFHKPVKIKISHLARRGSGGYKVKQGYVHELSELFDNNNSNQELDEAESFAKMQKTKQKQNRPERVPTPTFLTANENIIIEERRHLSDSDDISKLDIHDNLGLDVTPLQKVMSFRHTPSGDYEYKSNDDTDSDLFDNISDGDYSTHSDISSGDYNDELEMYESQLREIENITGELNHFRYCTGEATLLDDDDDDEDSECKPRENNEDGGTTEFIPMLETLSDIIEIEQSIESSFAQVERNELDVSVRSIETDTIKVNEVEQVEDEQEEIENSVSGESDPNESEDDELHEKYYPTCDFYHQNELRNESLGEEIKLRNAGNTDDHDINHKYDQEQYLEIKYPGHEGAGLRSFDVENPIGNKVSEHGCQADTFELNENYTEPIIAMTKDNESPCERDTAHGSNVSLSEAFPKSTDYTVDLSSDLQQIQRTSLQRRQQDMDVKSTPITSNDANTRTEPDYLNDKISRIDMGSQPRPHNCSGVESEYSKQGQSTECFKTSTKASYDIHAVNVEKSENTTEEIVPRKSNPSPTAVNEQFTDITVNISDNLQPTRRTSLDRRQQDGVVKSTPITSNDDNPGTQSGYLYDIISRIDMESQTRPHNNGVESENNKEGQSIECFETSTKAQYDLQVEIVEKNDNTTEDIVPRKSNPYLGIEYNASPTAVNEQCVFEYPKNTQTRIVTPLGTEDENKVYIRKIAHTSDYTDDERFKIRYPSSLSRRLYGPYSRLRCKENELADNCLTDSEDEREANPAGLSQPSGDNLHSVSTFPINCHNLDRLNVHTNNQSTASEYYDCGVLNTLNKSLIDGLTHAPVLRQSPTTNDDSSKRDSQTDNVSIHSDVHNSNPDKFKYTCYNVKTPFSSLTQGGGITLNLKAIIDGERNQPWQKTADGENNYVDVKLQHMRNEANSGKQEFDFAKTAYYRNSNCGVKFTQLPMHLECNSLDNKYESEHWRDINNVSLGVNTNTVKDVNDNTTMGVHIPSGASANKTKQENVDMNNDMVSGKGKATSVKTNLPRINHMPVSVTTQNITPHLMAAGDAVADDKLITNGVKKSPKAGETHITRKSVVLQTPGFQHVLEDEKGNLKLWPYSEFDNSDRLPVRLHRARKGINIPVKKGMSSSSSNMTVIQSAEHSAEMPENRVVHKYHSSSIVPADRSVGQVMKAHGESVQSVLLQDTNGNDVTESEIAAVLPRIAETISKMENSNAEEILPGITQSIAKLKNGGNLVITTMTRKIEEEESSSSGRGSPEPDYPVLSVDDLENSKIYLVQDSKGELFYVEDITSESQESAYSSSRNTSECISDTGNSPTVDRISKINSVGDSGIKQSTAQEILSAMYGDNDVKELTENEEEWSERTYEYDIPRRKSSGVSKDSFNTSYMVEEPGDTLPRLKSVNTNDKYGSSYQMSGGAPWVYDGGMCQTYSQVTQAVVPDDTTSVSAVSIHNVDNSGVRTIERYTVEGEAVDYPIPPPMFVPPMVIQTDVPQFSMVKVDLTPKQKDEGVIALIEAPAPEEPADIPIYKTVAHIQTVEKQPSPPKPVAKKKYKVIASKATEEEEQESHMRFDEIDYRFTSENVEYKMKPASAETQYFVRNSTPIEPQTNFRTEKRFELGTSSDQKHKSQIQVQQPKSEVYEENSYTYDHMKSELEQSESNMKVVRGSYLIKNTLEGVDGSLDDNINMFDGNFTMFKDNPLYQSDEDLYRRLDRERTENSRRQERIQGDFNQDITFETVDRFKKSKTVKREPEKPRQSLYQLLMNRLSTIETKDIKQTIDVKHDSVDLYGDPRFLQADGEYAQNVPGTNTNNFDTVGEKVDLLLKHGKAYITVKVTAERITPVDFEFNVWRKNQAIVTRTIEVDLLATEHRRRLYYKVMEEPAGGTNRSYKAGPNETILDSAATLDLFSKILGAADGEGDTEDIEVTTSSGKTSKPFPTRMDLLY